MTGRFRCWREALDDGSSVRPLSLLPKMELANEAGSTAGDNPTVMKRLFAILVAVLLPLQLAWGVAATYCQHETTSQGARHLGHHSHVHKEAKADAATSVVKLQADLDCGFCHATPAASLPTFEALPSAPVRAVPPQALGDLQLPSALQRTPDRPQWLRLA